ncbi:hypothetical protein [Sphingomonas guangdongensis]|uniref:hypothetical protein n=1 Tax=Sphingomonas guangdongensis TaxID=1141890 RepID=UPI0015CAEEC9|nr:hypothetical protein [Sphingomonas guangdongensis]
MVLVAPAAAQQPPQVGDRYELIRSYTTESRTGATGRSSARGSDTIEERVTAVTPEGVELVYDLPAGADAAARARTWELPARVRRGRNGTLTLMNAGELEQRLTTWLTAAKMDRSMCGKLIFTWNAFRIECDPQSVLAEIASYDPADALPIDGTDFSDPDALAPVPLVAQADGRSLVATLAPDPVKVRRARAETDMAVAEITQAPISLDAALAAHARDQVAGTITVTLQRGAGGAITRRTRVETLTITAADGTVERSSGTRTRERRPLPAEPAA